MNSSGRACFELHYKGLLGVSLAANQPPSALHVLPPPPFGADPIMGMVSTAIIGSRLGTAPLAAVGLCTVGGRLALFALLLACLLVQGARAVGNSLSAFRDGLEDEQPPLLWPPNLIRPFLSALLQIVFNFSNFIWNFLLYTTTPRIASAAAKGDTEGASKITSQVSARVWGFVLLATGINTVTSARCCCWLPATARWVFGKPGLLL